MHTKSPVIAVFALIVPVFAGCPVMAPPEPLDLSGTLHIDPGFSGWDMMKVVALDSKGVVAGETIPVYDGTDWIWYMPVTTEEGEMGVFWVEMKESPGLPLYYNEGEEEMFESGKTYTIHVTEKYIPVRNQGDLALIGNDTGHLQDDNYILIRDIRLSGEWEPLCRPGAKPFSGVFEGRGHKVSGLRLPDGGSFQYVGLFACLDNAKINDLNLEVSNTGLELSGASQQGLGALAGFAVNTSISKVVVSGPRNGLTVKKSGGGDFYIGGIAGKITGASVISQSAALFSITVEAESSGIGYLGGISGYAEPPTAGSVSISDCYNTGAMDLSIDGTGAFSGGILGYHNAVQGDSLITQCYATGNVSASVKSTTPAGTVTAGGLVGGGGGLSGTRSCAFMTTVSASASPVAAAVFGGGLGGLGLPPAGTASCYQLDTMTIAAPSYGVNAAGTVSRAGITEALFTATPLNWDFSGIWVWDPQAAYPVFQ
ncbi:MAG: hypothetical protein LBD86_02415 [Spirochaetaceae bacterium]|jgi:hypothetical protein|nr:hypothetical protein [Spirochaetaceae bacterium]